MWREDACMLQCGGRAMDDYMRGRDEPKKYWGMIIKHDMT